MNVAVGDTVTFTYNNRHNVYVHPSGTCDRAGATLLGDNDAGSVTYTFDTAETVTFACQAGSHCESGQIITITAGGSSGGGGEVCELHSNCGGQVWNDCASSCPEICGQPGAMICNTMCNAWYDCPNGQFFDAEAGGVCVAESDCTSVFELPPGVSMGRPFTKSASLTKSAPPVTAVIEERTSDWSF